MKNYIKPILLSAIVVTSFTSCISQENSEAKPKLIGTCEGCEAIFEYGNTRLNSIDTLPDFNKNGPKIKISGTVYNAEGKEPAPDVILYVYHTNQDGIYPTRGNEQGWAKRHGYIRGWVKTDAKGRYTFYTLKPGVYPSRTEPAHIHYTILEPNGKYYWLESCHFKGDSLLTEKEINPVSPRGGSSGLMILNKEGNIWTGTHDIILGKNVPGYE